MDSTMLPIATLILGTVLGILSSLIASLMKHRQSVTEKRIDNYLEARTELVEIISVLADVNIKGIFGDDDKDNYIQKVATLYFKNLDVFPYPVLNSLVTLHTCLKNRKGKLFQIINKTVVKIPEKEYSKFINQIAVFENTRFFAELVLKSKKVESRRNMAIKVHALNVLYNLNNYASPAGLIQIAKNQCKVEGI